MPPHVFGIVGEELVYGRFVRATSGYELERWATVELGDEFFGDGPLGGPLHDPGALREAVNRLLGELDGPVTQASLVLPDAWIRLVFAEADELPRSRAKRDEVLRWKLKRLVPFRVEDLRLRGVTVQPLADGGEAGSRLLVAFAVDSFLGQLETAFTGAGIQLGQILPAGLAAISAVDEVLAGLDLGALVTVGPDGYSIAFTRRGMPLLHRFRALETAAGSLPAETLVRRDLRMTRNYLRDRLEGAVPDRVLVLASEAEKEFWVRALELGFEQPSAAVGREQLPLRGSLPAVEMVRLAPLLGAASQEVA